MTGQDILHSFFLIFSGAAVIATAALHTRQPMLVAYIVLGALAGPYGMAFVDDTALLSGIAEIGIIFLLFLVGLDLPTQKLKNMLGESLLTALGTTAVFFSAGGLVMLSFGFSMTEAVIVGIGVTFSSTILGVKLLPTTVLHHRHVGEIVISLLLVQDLLAIVAMILIGYLGGSAEQDGTALLTLTLGLPALIAGALATVKFAILPLLQRFDDFHEYIFLLAIGWCLAIAQVAHMCGLSYEVGGFIAGVSLATSPIAQYIANHLKPLRDFFLVMFFFTVGASINLQVLSSVWMPIAALAFVILLIKPWTFTRLLTMQGETMSSAKEVGLRLGQASEFSLLVSYMALNASLLGAKSAAVLQAATVLTLLINSYLVVSKYPNPIAADPALRRD
ncbi:MAG: sodium:proton antiporter [Gammaproteobacteria bacterium]|nr:sodium:proton antiporter [Gammaproteobacteria bacterium]